MKYKFEKIAFSKIQIMQYGLENVFYVLLLFLKAEEKKENIFFLKLGFQNPTRYLFSRSQNLKRGLNSNFEKSTCRKRGPKF